MKTLYIYTGHFVSEFSHMIHTLAFIFLVNSLSRNHWYITIFVMVVNDFFPKYLHFRTLSSAWYHNYLHELLQFPTVHEIFSFRMFPLLILLFFDTCEAYTYTLYERYPPHNISAQILVREITNNRVNIRKYHSTSSKHYKKKRTHHYIRSRLNYKHKKHYQNVCCNNSCFPVNNLIL